MELDQAEATQAQASRATWPPRPDNTDQLQRMTRKLQLEDRPQDAHRDMLRILPVHKLDQNQNVVRPPAVGIHTPNPNHTDTDLACCALRGKALLLYIYNEQYISYIVSTHAMFIRYGLSMTISYTYNVSRDIPLRWLYQLMSCCSIYSLNMTILYILMFYPDTILR